MIQKLTKRLRTAAMVAGAYALVALAIVGFPPTGYFALACAAIFVLKRLQQSNLWTHGTARFANLSDVRRLKMIDAGSGLILGKLQRRTIWLPQAIHTCCYAPTGAGKAVSMILPFLQTCNESMFIVDFKLELYQAVAQLLTSKGFEVILLAPFLEDSHQFNALSLIDPNSPHAIDACKNIAKALVVRTGEEKQPHFLDYAETGIGGIAATAVGHDENPSLNLVRDIASSRTKRENTFNLMMRSNKWGGALQPIGGQLGNLAGEEGMSVISSTLRFLDFLSSPLVAKHVSRTTYDPRKLRTGKMAIFLHVPPHLAQANRGLLRYSLGGHIRICLEQGLSRPGLGNVHFVIDETALVGHMDCIDDALNIGRGSGLRMQFYLQSPGQLEKCFPQGGAQTLKSNTTSIYFGTSDFQTAKEISDRCGEQTIIIQDSGVTSQSSHSSGARESSQSYSHSTSTNYKSHGRHLLKPDEVLRLPPRTAITFVAGMPPIMTTLIRHYEERWLTAKGRARWMVDIARFTRALVAFIALIWLDVVLTPVMIRVLHVLMGH